ncbi:MAG: hypothetical protein ACJAUW_000876 [Yoonia sp.]
MSISGRSIARLLKVTIGSKQTLVIRRIILLALYLSFTGQKRTTLSGDALLITTVLA